MKNRMRITALGAVLLGAAAIASADEVYRCGETYSQKPCQGGRLVPVDDARSASQREQTTQAAQRDAKLADAMEKARLKEEAKAAPALVMSAAKPEPTAPEKKKKKADTTGKARKPELFTAVEPRKPGEAPRKKKAKTAS